MNEWVLSGLVAAGTVSAAIMVGVIIADTIEWLDNKIADRVRKAPAVGCDIHMVAQVRTEDEDGNEVWELVPNPDEYHEDYKWYGERNYGVFGALADVRNRYDYPVISQPRGFPDDFVVDDEGWHMDAKWMGEHSYSWLMLEEVEAYNWLQGDVLDFASDFVARMAELRQTVGTQPCRIVFGFDS